jgi:Fic family protein
LYLSLYLKQNRSVYYDLLDGVRKVGDWEAWLEFFVEGVRQTSDGAVAPAQGLATLFVEDRGRLESTGRRAGSALRVHEALKARPVASVQDVAIRTSLSYPTVSSAMNLLVEVGIARELTGRKRDRVFSYHRYMAILNEGTEAP